MKKVSLMSDQELRNEVVRLQDQMTDLMVAANAFRCVYADYRNHGSEIMDIAVNKLSLACIAISGEKLRNDTKEALK